MIHHISIGAQNPLRVALALAEVWQGKVYQFFPHPGSYLVSPADEYGSGIEVYPLGDRLLPGTEDQPCRIDHQPNAEGFVATHAAISVPTSQVQIEQIAAREGWRALVCSRSAFHVVEFWIENRFMLELLPPEFAAQYLSFTREPLKVEQVFGAPV